VSHQNTQKFKIFSSHTGLPNVCIRCKKYLTPNQQENINKPCLKNNKQQSTRRRENAARVNILEQPQSIFVVNQTIIEDTHHFMYPQPVDTASRSQTAFQPRCSTMRRLGLFISQITRLLYTGWFRPLLKPKFSLIQDCSD